MSERKPVIYTTQPDEIRGKHPHGQWVLDQPGLVINFLTDIDENNDPVVEPWAKRLGEFLASDDQPYLEFVSPHTGHRAYLQRGIAQRIMLTHAAWSDKVHPRASDRVELVDADTGVPLIRKLN